MRYYMEEKRMREMRNEELMELNGGEIDLGQSIAGGLAVVAVDTVIKAVASVALTTSGAAIVAIAGAAAYEVIDNLPTEPNTSQGILNGTGFSHH